MALSAYVVCTHVSSTFFGIPDVVETHLATTTNYIALFGSPIQRNGLAVWVAATI